MSVDVGMDVHRKRSQVAIIDAAGAQQRNRNVPNHPAQLVPILGALPPGTRWLSRPPTAGAGWSSCSRSWSWNRTWSIPAAARRSPRPGCRNDKVDAATLAQLLRADLLPQAWIAPQATRDLRALLGHRASLVRMGTAGKNRVHAILADRGIPDHSSLWTGPGRAWLADLELPATPRAIIQDRGGLLDALATPIARPEREIAALAKPDPRVQALMASRNRQAHRDDPGRRDRRHRPLPHRPQAVRLGRAHAQVGNSDRTLRHGHITKQGSPWVRGACRRPPRRPSAIPCSPAPTASWPAAAATTSPPPRSPGGCWPAASTS
jgi:Transposase